MKNQGVRKINRPVVKAAIYGAVIFGLISLIDIIICLVWPYRGGGDLWYNLFERIIVLPVLPAACITNAFGFEGGFMSIFIVNMLLGAIIFAFIANFWQLFVKKETAKTPDEITQVKSMNKLNTKRKFRAVLIAALVGGVLFAGLSLAAIKEVPQSQGEGGYVIGIPSDIILGGTKLGKWLLHQPGDLLARLAVMMVNGLIGAFLFAAPVAFWQFIVKGNHEDKN
jgi:hypothetical protein